MNLIKSNQTVSSSYKFDDVVLSLLQDGLLVLNSTNQIIGANDSVGFIFGLTNCRELLDKSFSELYLNPDDAETFIEILLESNRVLGLKNTFIKANGVTFVGSCYATVTEESEIKVILVRDVTASVQASENLSTALEHIKKITEEFEQFTYIVSHDLKAPLRAINNLSEWIQEDINDCLTEESRKNFNLLRSRVARLEDMICGLSSYSKIGKQKETFESIDMKALLGDVLNCMQPSSNVEVELPNQMPVLNGPRKILRLIFSQLIANAIKFNNDPRKRVKIHTEDRGDHFEFTVEDNGPGIPLEYHESVFVLFHTLQPKDKVETTGAGLTLVKRALEEYGETIRIESEAGLGCKFIFTWSKIKL
jgi:light-regulated signal transduction histidine kinase (bacteriophytochrome)